MAYVGQSVSIPVGELGLLTDIPETKISATALSRANNISFEIGGIKKDSGSTKFNATALDSGAGIVGVWDWFPTGLLQRMIALTDTGKLYRDTGNGTFTAGAAIDTSFGSPTLDMMFVEGGNEDASESKKLFTYSGTKELSYINGDATVVTPAVGAADWVTSLGSATLTTSTDKVGLASHGLLDGEIVYFTNVVTTTSITAATIYYVINKTAGDFEVSLTSGGAKVAINLTGSADLFANTASTHPTGGFIFKDRHIAYGNSNFPHQLYISAAADHSDFVTGVSTLSVFPGEADAIAFAIVYRGFVLIFKKPWGVYVLNDNGSGTVTDWSINRLDSNFGVASPHGAIQVLNDLLVANREGSINSLQTSQAAGDLEAGDILSNAEIENYIRTNYDKSGISSTQAIYYSEKKKALFTLRGKGSSAQDQMLVIDLNNPQTPRYSVANRDAAECLALRRDDDGIRRPVYGTADGFVYLMDQGVQSVDGSAYVGEFETPDIDFSFLDPALAHKNKLFDFLSVNVVGRDSTPLFCDVTINGKFSETISIVQVKGAVLGTFLLGTDSLRPTRPVSIRTKLHGAGKRIRLRFYTTGIDNFEVQNVTIDFRLGDEGAEGE